MKRNLKWIIRNLQIIIKYWRVVKVMLESKSYIATPPGAAIQEQLDDRGMMQNEKLERVLGIPASFWNKLEAIYQEKLAKIRNEFRMV